MKSLPFGFCLAIAWLALPAMRSPAADLLGPQYKSENSGIALRPPVNCTRIISGVPGQIVEFDDADHHWSLKVTRLALDNDLPLTTFKDQYGQDHDGLLQQTIKQLQDTRISQIVNQDVIHIGANSQIQVGILVMRRDDHFQRRLVQEAIVCANNRLYYLLELNTPARPDAGGAGEDLGERLASDTFNAMVDSVELLDRAVIYRDQVDRIIRFRGLIANWVPSYLASRMDGPHYYRMLRNGRDIGYKYEIDEYDDKAGRIADTPVIRVSVRSNSTPEEGTFTQVQSRMISTVDRKHENWVTLEELATGVPPAGEAKSDKTRQIQTNEYGASDERSQAEPAVPMGGGLDAPNSDINTIQPNLNMAEVWTLDVVRNINSSDQSQPQPAPFKQNVPLWYLPKAMSYLLPRLLPYKEPKTYMMAVYVSDGDHGLPAVATRYVDVLSPEQIMLDGKPVVVVPVKDKIGLEGTVTTHYLDPDNGAYLGSAVTMTDENGTPTTDMILASDEATLRRLWPNCNLTRPDKIVDGPAPAN